MLALTPRACRILKGVRAAAGPSSKLLLVDNLLPYPCAEVPPREVGAGAALAPAGPGLAPSLHGYLLDGAMMGMLNAQERTYAEMDALARAAEWRVAQVRWAVGL